MVFSSKDKRPSDTIGRILESSRTPPVKITQTKKPKNLLKPWESREKELIIEFAPPEPVTPTVITSSSPPYATATEPTTQIETVSDTTNKTDYTSYVGYAAGVIAGAKLAYDLYYSGQQKRSKMA